MCIDKTANRPFCWAAEHHLSAGDVEGDESPQGEVGASGGETTAVEASGSLPDAGDKTLGRRKSARKCEPTKVLPMLASPSLPLPCSEGHDNLAVPPQVVRMAAI